LSRIVEGDGATIFVAGTDEETCETFVSNLEVLEPSWRLVLLSPKTGDFVGAVKEASPDTLVLVMKDGEEEGYRLCRRLKAQAWGETLPLILLMKGSKGLDGAAKAISHGADVFLTEPIDGETMVAQIQAMVRIHRSGLALQREKEALMEALTEKTIDLEVKSQELDRRVRILDCLYGVSEIREKPGLSFDEILQGVVNLIVSSWQYPEVACARIRLGYHEYRTENYHETPWKLSHDVEVHGEWAGTLEVNYLEKCWRGDSPFLEDERALLKAVCERLGRIAERMQAEDSLLLESENMLTMLGSMEDWVCKVNDQYEMVYVNSALEKEFGRPAKKKCYEYFYDRKDICSACRNEEVFWGRTVRRQKFFDKNGKTYDVIDTPMMNPDGSMSKVSILRDLTAMRQAQKELEERELLYRSVTESTADGVVMVLDGKIIFVNHAILDMFGYEKPEDIMGLDILELMDIDFKELFRKVFNPKEKDETIENPVRGLCVTRKGRQFWVSADRRVVSHQSRPAVLATLRDISEEIAHETSIQELAEYLRRENVKLRSSIKERYRFGDIIGKSLPMQKVYELILQAAGTDANVVILGDSGTGKELVARAIHRMSPRANKSFVPVNCGGIPETLVESEFFGHRKGAFTGAHIDKRGYLATANGGTLFLDEVAELGINIQVKLLRALENGEYIPVGDTQPRRSSLRIISATNQDFPGMVNSGLIREDFYYRISVIPIHLPPLRERKEDIPLLVEHFLTLFSKEKRPPVIPGKVMEILHNYDWPGNVRELQSTIQRFLVVGNFNFLSLQQKGMSEDLLESKAKEPEEEMTDLKKATIQFQKGLILKALRQNRWHRGKVAATLNIDPKTLYTKMKKIGIL
jgi:PAS domain S-box-containing protein